MAKRTTTTSTDKRNNTMTLALVLSILSLIASSSSSGVLPKVHARKTNWNEIHEGAPLKPRTKGLHNYETTLFSRQSDAELNETYTPVALDDVEDDVDDMMDTSNSTKARNDRFYTEQGKKSSKRSSSIKQTPRPKRTINTKTAVPSQSPSTTSAPSETPAPTVTLDDDIFFVVSPSKKGAGKKAGDESISPAPTMSLAPFSAPSLPPAPSLSPAPIISIQPKTLRGTSKTSKSKKSSSSMDRKSDKGGNSESSPVKDSGPKFTMKKNMSSSSSSSKSGDDSKGKEGMGMGMKSSSKAKLKKSKSSKNNSTPTAAPTTATTLAPNSMTSPPAAGPPSSEPPTRNGPALVRIQVAPYQLRYVFEQTEIPSKSDIDEVETLTAAYLISFVGARFSQLTAFETEVTGDRFILLMPYEMNYTSTAVFPSNATDIPTAAELDLVVLSAFEGNNQGVYIDLLSRLPENNIFGTTTEVLFDLAVTRSAGEEERIFEEGDTKSGKNESSSSSSTSGGGVSKVAIGAATGAGVVVVLAIAGAQVRYRSNGGEGIIGVRGHLQFGRGGRRGRSSRDNNNNAHGSSNRRGSILLDKGANAVTETSTVAGNTYQADSTIYGDDSTVSRRPTRFARTTRFAADFETQSLATRSLASRSEWALSTRAVSEEGSDVDSTETSSDTDDIGDDSTQSYGRPVPYPAHRQSLYDEEEPNHQRDPLVSSARQEDGSGLDEPPMQYNDAASQDNFVDNGMLQDDLSVDSFVPLRVVDLIKRFSPSSGSANSQTRDP